MDFKSYFEELKRRNVFKAALAYLVVGWIILQVISIVFPLLNIATSVSKTVLVILLVGFPIWLVFAWVYEVTPEGLKKTKQIDRQESITEETGAKFKKVIVGALMVAIILLGANLYLGYSRYNSEQVTSESTQKNGFYSTLDEEEKSIAVLAFADMSPERDQEYFSDGISEEILNLLAKNPQLKVISRTSSFYFKNKEATTEEIGNKLDINYLLEGSVRKAGDIVRITVQLINISDGSHIWSETYDRKLEDIFNIQDDIAEAVAKKLEVSLLGERSKEIDSEAYTLYLQAKHLYAQITSESLEKALHLLKEANATDPDNAAAWELMSEIYYIQGFSMNILERDEAYEQGVRAAKKAVEINPDFAKGYMELAKWALVKFEFDEAKENAQRAILLEPDNPDILRGKGQMTFDSIDVRIRDTKRALDLDPLLYTLYFNVGLLYYWKGENEKALEQVNIFEEFQPESMGTSSQKALLLMELGRIEDALEEIQKETNPFWGSYVQIMIEHAVGNKVEAGALLEEFISTYPKEAVNIADIYGFMGNREQTFKWLKKALETKDPTLTEGVYYPTFRKYHDDPRWQQLLEDMGVPEVNGIPGYID